MYVYVRVWVIDVRKYMLEFFSVETIFIILRKNDYKWFLDLVIYLGIRCPPVSWDLLIPAIEYIFMVSIQDGWKLSFKDDVHLMDIMLQVAEL